MTDNILIFGSKNDKKDYEYRPNLKLHAISILSSPVGYTETEYEAKTSTEQVREKARYEIYEIDKKSRNGDVRMWAAPVKMLSFLPANEQITHAGSETREKNVVQAYAKPCQLNSLMGGNSASILEPELFLEACYKAQEIDPIGVKISWDATKKQTKFQEKMQSLSEELHNHQLRPNHFHASQQLDDRKSYFDNTINDDIDKYVYQLVNLITARPGGVYFFEPSPDQLQRLRKQDSDDFFGPAKPDLVTAAVRLDSDGEKELDTLSAAITGEGKRGMRGFMAGYCRSLMKNHKVGEENVNKRAVFLSYDEMKQLCNYVLWHLKDAKLWDGCLEAVTGLSRMFSINQRVRIIKCLHYVFTRAALFESTKDWVQRFDIDSILDAVCDREQELRFAMHLAQITEPLLKHAKRPLDDSTDGAESMNQQLASKFQGLFVKAFVDLFKLGGNGKPEESAEKLLAAFRETHAANISQQHEPLQVTETIVKGLEEITRGMDQKEVDKNYKTCEFNSNCQDEQAFCQVGAFGTMAEIRYDNTGAMFHFYPNEDSICCQGVMHGECPVNSHNYALVFYGDSTHPKGIPVDFIFAQKNLLVTIAMFILNVAARMSGPVGAAVRKTLGELVGNDERLRRLLDENARLCDQRAKQMENVVKQFKSARDEYKKSKSAECADQLGEALDVLMLTSFEKLGPFESHEQFHTRTRKLRSNENELGPFAKVLPRTRAVIKCAMLKIFKLSDKGMSQFVNEVKAYKHLRKEPNCDRYVPKLYSYGVLSEPSDVAPGAFYILIEYLGGDRMNERNPAHRAARDKAVGVLYNQGLEHGDPAARNVRTFSINGQLQAKLFDFGEAKIVKKGLGLVSASSMNKKDRFRR